MSRSAAATSGCSSPGAAPAGRTGIANAKVLPAPAALSSQIRPPCSSTIRFDSVRPSPALRPRLAAATLERLEDPLLLGLRDADPGVAVTSASSPAISAVTSTDPPSGKADRVREQVEHDLLELELVGHTTATSGASSAIAIRWRAARSRTIASPCSSRSGSERAASIRPRLHLREVEDLVDQLEQVPPGVADVADVLLLAVVELAEHPLEQHVGEADHGVQRRAQLVRHAGQELPTCGGPRPQLALALLEGDEQLDILDRDRALRREGGHGSTVRSSNAATVTPQRDDADHLLGGQHRDPEHRPEAAELALDLVAGIGERVEDLHGAALEPDPADQRPFAAGDRGRGQVVAVRLRRADREREPVHVAVEHDLAGVRAASRTAWRSTVSNTGSSSNAGRPMTSSTSAVAASRSPASASERSSCDDLPVGHIAGDFTEST